VWLATIEVAAKLDRGAARAEAFRRRGWPGFKGGDLGRRRLSLGRGGAGQLAGRGGGGIGGGNGFCLGPSRGGEFALHRGHLGLDLLQPRLKGPFAGRGGMSQRGQRERARPHENCDSTGPQSGHAPSPFHI